MEIKVKIKLKPLSFFEKYAFKDHDGDYWEEEQFRNHFNKHHIAHKESTEPIWNKYVNRGWLDINEEELESCDWMMERILTKENDSMYFV